MKLAISRYVARQYYIDVEVSSFPPQTHTHTHTHTHTRTHTHTHTHTRTHTHTHTHTPAGQNIQDASEDGESLLSLACSAGYYELAEVLLRMRASVEDRGVKGQSVMRTRTMQSQNICDFMKNRNYGVNANLSFPASFTKILWLANFALFKCVCVCVCV